MTPAIREGKGGTLLAVHVLPRASQSTIVGVQSDHLKVRLTAPPVEGAANAALVEFLADKLDLPKRQIEVVAGHTSRYKLISVSGLAPCEVEKRLLGPDRPG